MVSPTKEKRMTHEGKNIIDMTQDELREGLAAIWKKLARVRGHKLRDRLHDKREMMEGRIDD